MQRVISDVNLVLTSNVLASVIADVMYKRINNGLFSFFFDPVCHVSVKCVANSFRVPSREMLIWLKLTQRRRSHSRCFQQPRLGKGTLLIGFIFTLFYLLSLA